MQSNLRAKSPPTAGLSCLGIGNGLNNQSRGPVEDADIKPAERRTDQRQAHIQGQIRKSLKLSAGKLKIGLGVMKRANVE